MSGGFWVNFASIKSHNFPGASLFQDSDFGMSWEIFLISLASSIARMLANISGT